MLENVPRDRAEEEPRQARLAARPDHDDRRAALAGELDDLVRRVALADGRRRGDPELAQPGGRVRRDKAIVRLDREPLPR